MDPTLTKAGGAEDAAPAARPWETSDDRKWHGERDEHHRRAEQRTHDAPFRGCLARGLFVPIVSNAANAYKHPPSVWTGPAHTAGGARG